jgi:hypothetical protein
MNPWIILLIFKEGIDVKEEKPFIKVGVVEIYPLIEHHSNEYNPLYFIMLTRMLPVFVKYIRLLYLSGNSGLCKLIMSTLVLH